MRKRIVRLCLLLAGLCTIGACFKVYLDFHIQDTFVQCHINREECNAFGFDAFNNPTCLTFDTSQSFDTTACFDSTITTAFQTCNRWCSDLYDLSSELCEARATSTRPSQAGDCLRLAEGSKGATAFVSCTRGGRVCASTQTRAGKTVCTDQSNLVSEDASGCFDPTKTDADFVCRNNDMVGGGIGSLNEPRVQITSVELNSQLCVPPAASATLAYGIGVGQLGTVTVAGVTTPLTATGGSVVVAGSCDSSGEFCVATEVRSMRITFGNLVVQGATLTNLDGQLIARAPIVVTNGVRKIPKGNFKFQMFGTIPGGNTSVQVSPTQDVTLQLNGQAATFTTSFSGIFTAPDKTVTPVTINVSVPSSVTNPGAGCGSFSTLQTLFGFEDLSWTSSQASLSLSPTLHTQGCYGLNVAGSGYMVVNSARFLTPLPAVSSTLALDVFVPTGQPNPFWLGAVQAYASCPSGGMNNAYLGQVELTGKPTGAFSTLTYPVNASVRNTLSQAHNDCFFSIAVNVNATPTPVVLDNLRFIP